jgi:hypothetical protein
MTDRRARREQEVLEVCAKIVDYNADTGHDYDYRVRNTLKIVAAAIRAAKD